MRIFILAFLAFLTLTVQSVSAQIAGKDLPDMKDLRSVFGGIASGEITVDPIVDANGLVGSAIAVPDTGARGAVAKAIAEPLGAAVDDPAVADKLEDAFNLAVLEVENALPQLGFQQRDYGVAFALFFVMNWEIANDAELPPEVSKRAARKIVETVQAAYSGDTGLSDAELDAQYDMFLTVPLAILVMVEAFEKEGGVSEAAEMREFAGQAFEQVTGRSAYDIDITDTGEIKGY